jgi:predicted PurR-regulated permease PerM
MPDHKFERIDPQTPREIRPAPSSSALGPLGVGVIAVAALYFARELFVPLALAILLSFALGPLVTFLRRWHFGRIPSTIAAVLVGFLIISGVGSLIGSQLAQLAEKLPQYQSNISEKIHSLQGATTESGLISRASGMLRGLTGEITRTAQPHDDIAPVAPALTPHGDQPQQPVPVEIHRADPTTLELIQTILDPLLQPLATTGIVIVFVIFFLLQRGDLRDRFIRLAGARDLQRTTKALDDAGRRLSRYLLAQTALNAGSGVLIAIGLWLIGVPNPILWGILAMLLRFVPYIGPVIAAIFPAALALAIDPGWSMLLWTGALFLVVEAVTGQLIEPFLYSRSTGLSAVAVVLAAAFWTWLWGPVGLLLSTPLTLCLVVLGRHVERLEFLDIILGDRPALTREEKFYQRMLANNPDEAAHQAEEFLKENPLAAYYDEVAIRGLALAQMDVNRGVLDHERRVLIKEAIEGVIDDLSDYNNAALRRKDAEDALAALSTAPSDGAVPELWRGKAVMCIAGRGSLDEAAAAMLAQLLDKRGIGTNVVPSDAVSAANMFRLDVTEVQMVCLSYLEPGEFTNARFLVRRLRRKLPRVEILVGFWTLSEDDARHRDAQRETGADIVVTSLQQAVERVVAAATQVALPVELSLPQPDAQVAPAAA